MKKQFTLSIMLLAASLLAMAPIAVRAEEGEAPAKKSGGEDGEKKKSTFNDVTGGKFDGDPVYVHLEPMTMPIITNAGAEQLITMLIDVEVKDFDIADQMHADMPRVRDALMRSLYGGLGEGTLRNGKLADISKIKAKTLSALQEIIPGDGMKNVLIQGVSQRML